MKETWRRDERARAIKFEASIRSVAPPDRKPLREYFSSPAHAKIKAVGGRRKAA